MGNNGKRVRSLLIFILCLGCIPVLYIIGRPASYVWVMDAGDLKNEFYLVKMCPTGKQLVRIQFGQSEAVGLDKKIIRYDENGNILAWQPGFNKPQSIVFAENKNDLLTEIKCTISFYSDRFSN